jgi:hypothetical protein
MKSLAGFVCFITLVGMPPAQGSDAGTSASTNKMGSMVIPWDAIQARTKPTKTGQRRDVFDAPTPTLDKFHCHVTTLNAGETPGRCIVTRRKSPRPRP